MTRFQKIFLFILRISLGWLLFYSGITKIINPAWSAAGYLENAKMFAGLYQWLASPGVLPIINVVNEWGLTLLGISLIFGIGVRISGILGAILMLFYYFPVLDFPYPNAHSYIVDEHIVYAAALLLIASFRAGRIGGLEGWLSRSALYSRSSLLQVLFK